MHCLGKDTKDKARLKLLRFNEPPPSAGGREYNQLLRTWSHKEINFDLFRLTNSFKITGYLADPGEAGLFTGRNK